MENKLELLSPARDADIGIEAIKHGADAVYIGGPAFGARAGAANSVSDIARLVEFAHCFHAKIFVAFNTIFHDSEIEEARKLSWQLYDAGVDALIMQDMGLLELDMPPLQFHASTQCDIRTPEKAKFLQDVGFSQVVLAREMSLPEIRQTYALLDPSTRIEYFIHGALCVAFSGQCNISFAHTGRSANRGECSQACRLPYTLADHEGRIVAYDKHLLSMKDNDQSGNLRALVEAGVRSFKIEGRYKDMAYVKNATAHYRQLLDDIIAEQPQYSRDSSGVTRHLFVPQPEKTFNRSSTDYFTNGRQHDIGAFDTPKFSGEAIGRITKLGPDWFEIDGVTEDGTVITLHNGDGVSYQPSTNKGANKLVGMRINVVEGKRLFPNEMATDLKVGQTIYRNRDQAFERQLEKDSAERRIGVSVSLYEVSGELQLTLTDSDGISATVAHAGVVEFARDAEKALATLQGNLSKFGNTDFEVTEVHIAAPYFVPASAVNALRREATAALVQARVDQRPRLVRAAPVEPPVPYPSKQLDFLANVFNTPARNFYKKHGVELIADAYEAGTEHGDVSLMITKHCLRYSFNLCPKEAKDWKLKGVKAEPMTLINGNEKLKLRFDCKACEMHVVGKIKPGMKIQLHSS